MLLALGLIGAVTVDSDVEQLDATDSTTTTVAGRAGPGETLPTVPGGQPQPGGPAPGAPGGPAPTQAPGGPTTTTAPPASQAPGDAVPTRPGLYVYKSTTGGKEGRSELRVSSEAGAPAGEQRLLHRETSDGNTTESSIAWRSNGVFERSRTFPSGEGGDGSTCDWEPDVMIAARPLRAESTWRWDSKCRSKVEGQDADFRFTGEARVTGAQQANVGGRSVSVWRIQMTGKIEITGSYQGQPFTVVVDITSDDQFAPQQGITVRSESTSKVTGPGQPPQETRTLEELQNLDPA